LYSERWVRVYDLLEDFDVVASMTYMALVPRCDPEDKFIHNIQAAILASTLDLKSIDYAMKEYCTKSDEKTDDRGKVDLQYVEAYMSAKGHIRKVMSRLVTEGKDAPSAGVFCASLVLERLRTSFFAAHLLYRLGNEYEAHAVSRLILEQIAWAYSAYRLKDPRDIQKIVTTKTISHLREVLPETGKLYGHLSKKTHIDYSSHPEFLGIDQGRYIIALTANNYYDYARVILILADIFAIVWEYSQFDYMRETKSVEIKAGNIVIKKDRIFLKVIERHLEQIKNCS
jgi:hypothetical protein